MPGNNSKNLLKISDITIEKLKTGELKNKLPEIYELKDVIENTTGHINQSVFNHTIDVLESLEKLIVQSDKKKLIMLAALFHDVGKKEKLLVKDGKTSCPGHELAGAKKLSEILARLNLSPAEKDYIIKIVSNHGKLHDLMGENRDNLEAEYEKIKIKYRDIIYEILLLTEADIMGGDFKKDLPEEYNFRMNFYNEKIKELKK